MTVTYTPVDKTVHLALTVAEARVLTWFVKRYSLVYLGDLILNIFKGRTSEMAEDIKERMYALKDDPEVKALMLQKGIDTVNG